MTNDLVIWQNGFVKDNILVSYNEKLHGQVLTFYNDEQVEYCIRKKKKKVSAAAHGYYRGVIIPLCSKAEIFGGWDVIEIHKFFANMFLKDVETKQIRGKVYIIETILSTSDISLQRMIDFISSVRHWLLQEDIDTPEPQK